MAVRHTDDKGFKKDVLKTKGVTVVAFVAEWAGPCNLLAEDYERVSGRLGNQINFLSVDIEESPMTTKDQSIKGVPQIIVYRDGVIASTKIGALTEDDMMAWLEAYEP